MPSCDFNNFPCDCCECKCPKCYARSYFGQLCNNCSTNDETVVEPSNVKPAAGASRGDAPAMKTCKDCNMSLERETNFYKGGKNNSSFQARCKSCHNSNRINYALKKKVYIRKGRGWDSYSEEKKADIKQMFEEKIKVKEIALKYAVSHPTVYKWKKIIMT